MKLFKKKSVHHSTQFTNDTPVVKESNKAIFDMNFEQFIGQTVTVFVNAGGEVGKGFTGILMGSSCTYIKLLMLPSKPPDCALGNSCKSSIDNVLFCALCPFNKKAALGSIAIIPVNNIAAFIHNTLGLVY